MNCLDTKIGILTVLQWFSIEIVQSFRSQDEQLHDTVAHELCLFRYSLMFLKLINLAEV